MPDYVLTNNQQLNPLDVASAVANSIGISPENVRYKIFASPNATMIHIYNDSRNTFATGKIRPTMTLDVKNGGNIHLVGPATDELVTIVQKELDLSKQRLSN